ncbi:MAG: hypothetical protein GQ477_03805 [Nanohaloarchaea archaeon]|nr:hypothetical protein [Candidatus Nanohaloarchaea archaeon]
MRKGMTITITLVMAMLVALVVAFVLISMFGTAMGDGGEGMTDSIAVMTDNETGLACNSHCTTCCVTGSKTYCENTLNGAPQGCKCQISC